ncbi:MAG: prepilin-type N-terminal cleavage/methylation domain-containing protein [Sedimentisphaerales bacterium]|nr:prepilin-type N-terminal cleavage/methylation domain-containing protein [Sedimentisphaerales bacterium]
MVKRRRAFSLVELMIVVAVLGILAAVVVPQFRNYSTEAKSSAAKSNLRLMRSAIELYSGRHSGVPPGYPGDDIDKTPTSTIFRQQTTQDDDYLREVPENPFNGLDTMLIVPNGASFPAAPTGNFGWVYQPVTATIKVDWPGTDNDGMAFYDY